MNPDSTETIDERVIEEVNKGDMSEDDMVGAELVLGVAVVFSG